MQKTFTGKTEKTAYLLRLWLSGRSDARDESIFVELLLPYFRVVPAQTLDCVEYNEERRQLIGEFLGNIARSTKSFWHTAILAIFSSNVILSAGCRTLHSPARARFAESLLGWLIQSSGQLMVLKRCSGALSAALLILTAGAPAIMMTIIYTISGMALPHQ